VEKIYSDHSHDSHGTRDEKKLIFLKTTIFYRDQYKEDIKMLGEEFS